jgi:hypothetical protein
MEALTTEKRAAMVEGLLSIVVSHAVGRVIDDAIKQKPRFYRVRETAFGTASYETILRNVGPLGPLAHGQAQHAIIVAALAMGIARADTDGNLSMVEGGK